MGERFAARAPVRCALGMPPCREYMPELPQAGSVKPLPSTLNSVSSARTKDTESGGSDGKNRAGKSVIARRSFRNSHGA